MPNTDDILLLSSGEYSDTSVHGPFRVLRDFDLGEACEAWCGHRPPVDLDDLKDDGTLRYDDSEYTFIAFLVANDYLSDMHTHNIHIGSYGRLDF